MTELMVKEICGTIVFVVLLIVAFWGSPWGKN